MRLNKICFTKMMVRVTDTPYLRKSLIHRNDGSDVKQQNDFITTLNKKIPDGRRRRVGKFLYSVRTGA